MLIDLAINKRSIDYFALFESLVNDIFKAGAIDIVLMMYKVIV